MKTPKIHDISISKMDSVRNGQMTFATSPRSFTDKDGTVLTAVPALIQFLDLGDTGNNVDTSTHGQSDNADTFIQRTTQSAKDGAMKSSVFEEKVKHYQNIFNTAKDDIVRGRALSKLADMYTCGEYRSLIKQRTKDGKHDQVRMIVKMFGSYVGYRNCLEDLQTAKENARSIAFKRNGQVAKTPHICYEELDRILKASIKKSRKDRDNDDAMEIYMAVCTAIMECKRQDGRIDLFATYTYKDTNKNVYAENETVKYVTRTETYTNFIYRQARRAIDSHASVKALINGITYTSLEDEETEKMIYIKSAKYADIAYESENAMDNAIVDVMVEHCKATEKQADIAKIILRHNGNITQREIATLLNCDVSTVRDHLKGLRKKLIKMDGWTINDHKIRVKVSTADGCINRWIEKNVPIIEEENSDTPVRKKQDVQDAETITIPTSAKYECYDFNYWKQPCATLSSRYYREKMALIRSFRNGAWSINADDWKIATMRDRNPLIRNGKKVVHYNSKAHAKIETEKKKHSH